MKRILLFILCASPLMAQVNVQGTAIQIGGNTGAVNSITTTGTNGAATLSGGVLNIPQYQGGITLTTSGTSGAATLSGNTLNIPQYAGGVTQIIAGTNVTISPSGGTGAVTVNASGGSSSTPVWQRLGTVIAPTTAPSDTMSQQVQEVSAIWGAPEASSLSSYSQVMKFAYTKGWFGSAEVCFGESPDGVTPPVPVGTCITGHWGSTLFKSGTTYYLFASTGTQIDIYSGTTLAGLTLAHSNVLACGSNGSEVSGSTYVGGVWITGGSGSNWNMLYSCEYANSSTGFAEWLATSSDSGVTWTKASANPKIGVTGAHSTQCYEGGGSWMYESSSTNVEGYFHCGPAGLVPTPYIYRVVSTDNGNTFTLDSAPTITAQTTAEGVGLTNGQIADAFVAPNASGTGTLLYYTEYTNGCPGAGSCTTPAYINVASLNSIIGTVVNEVTTDGLIQSGPQFATNYTPNSAQNYQNIVPSMSLAASESQGNVVLDTSICAGEANVFANFVGSSGTAISSYLEPCNQTTFTQYTAEGGNAVPTIPAYPPGSGWAYSTASQPDVLSTYQPNNPDYTVSAYVQSFSVLSSDNVDLFARAQSGANTNYQLQCNAAGTCRMYSVVAGSASQIGSASITWNLRTTHLFKFSVIGNTLNAYYDGTLIIGPITDTSVTAAGQAGFRAASVAVTDFSVVQTKPSKYYASLTPAAATASSCVEQTFTVTGLGTTQSVRVSAPSAIGAHVWIGGTRVSAANTLAIDFCADATAGTPPAGTYVVEAQ